ncbi:MAG: dihydrodipicolinate synthase family protein [Candidimonas sp.]
MKPGWKGVFPALVTPFDANGALDKAQLTALVDILRDEGVTGLVVGGSTGEFYSMNVPERIELFETVREHVTGEFTLIAGTSSINHSETLQLTREAKAIGYDGCMVLPPIYCLPTHAEVLDAFKDVAAIGLPIMIYNNPGRAGFGFTPDLVGALSKIENVAAYKESARDIYLISEIFRAARDNISLFAGLEPYGSALMARGAVGMVSTISNVCAREVVAYFDAFQQNDTAKVAQLQQLIDEMYHLLARSRMSNYAFAKSAMVAIGRPAGLPRRPHRPADDALLKEIAKEIGEIYARADVKLVRV